MVGFLPILWLNDVPLCGCVSVCVYTHTTLLYPQSIDDTSWFHVLIIAHRLQ